MTYEGLGEHDPVAVRAHVGDFFRSLRYGLDRGAFPYVWVPEWHKSGHGLHLHFAVGQYVPRALISSAWGRGFVHIKLLSDIPVGSGRFAEARLAARYLGKYVTKSFGDVDKPGLHRYDVAQGFNPPLRVLTGRSRADVVAQACRVMGNHPEVQWLSDDTEGWRGPPSVWLAWS